LRFVAIKVISDESSFLMPPMERFIRSDGTFRSGSFALYAALRPWLWGPVLRLARNSAKASYRLCEFLSKNAGDAASVTAEAGF
jgi:hypothetical protein